MIGVLRTSFIDGSTSVKGAETNISRRRKTEKRRGGNSVLLSTNELAVRTVVGRLDHERLNLLEHDLSSFVEDRDGDVTNASRSSVDIRSLESERDDVALIIVEVLVEEGDGIVLGDSLVGVEDAVSHVLRGMLGEQLSEDKRVSHVDGEAVEVRVVDLDLDKVRPTKAPQPDEQHSRLPEEPLVGCVEDGTERAMTSGVGQVLSLDVRDIPGCIHGLAVGWGWDWGCRVGRGGWVDEFRAEALFF